MPPPRKMRGLSQRAYDQQLKWFRERIPVTDAEMAVLQKASADRAFRISGVTQMRLVESVLRSIDKAIANGETLGKFKQRVSGVLFRAWGGSFPHRIEAIFRTETQRAYNQGRWIQLTNRNTLNLRPFWIYDAILDSRTSALCRSLDGMLRPAADPVWLVRWPPLHVNCRSGVRSLRRSDVHKNGGVTISLPRTDVGDGFGKAPQHHLEPVNTDTDDPFLRDELRIKLQ